MGSMSVTVTCVVPCAGTSATRSPCTGVKPLRMDTKRPGTDGKLGQAPWFRRTTMRRSAPEEGFCQVTRVVAIDPTGLGSTVNPDTGPGVGARRQVRCVGIGRIRPP